MLHGLSQTLMGIIKSTGVAGPDGATSYPSGNGDFVIKIERSGGNVDVGLTCGYHGED